MKNVPPAKQVPHKGGLPCTISLNIHQRRDKGYDKCFNWRTQWFRYGGYKVCRIRKKVKSIFLHFHKYPDMSKPFQCQNKCTLSLTQGWTWPVKERHTVCAGRTASGWCHLHRSKRWRRPRAEWWKTSSGGRMSPCPWWTGQRSSRLAGLKRMENGKLKQVRKIKTNQVISLYRPTSLLLQAEAQNSLPSLIFKFLQWWYLFVCH